MHWIHWKLASRTTPEPARLIRLEGGVLVLATEDGGTLRWWNHDPVRVATYAGPEGGRVLLHPSLHALSIGNAWFNCDTSAAPTPCRPPDELR
jgi:hypothetical protein